MTTAITTSPSIEKAVEALREGKSFKDVLGHIAQPEQFEPEEVAPPSLRISDDQRRALKRVEKVYGSVVPETFRALEPSEVTRLLEEREVLKEVEALAKARVDAIRDTVLNHSDVEAPDDAPLAKNGHRVHATRVSPDEGDKEFSVEVRSGGVRLDSNALKAMSEDPDSGFTHEDYLACTTQTRVFDEHKAMLLLKEKPALVEALANATTEGTPSVGVYVRKRKK